jgi:hypothetical protein
MMHTHDNLNRIDGRTDPYQWTALQIKWPMNELGCRDPGLYHNGSTRIDPLKWFPIHHLE